MEATLKAAQAKAEKAEAEEGAKAAEEEQLKRALAAESADITAAENATVMATKSANGAVAAKQAEIDRLNAENSKQKTTISAQNVTLHSLAEARDEAQAKEKSAAQSLAGATTRAEDNAKMAATFREELSTTKAQLSAEQKKSESLESGKAAAAKALKMSEDARHELEKKVQSLSSQLSTAKASAEAAATRAANLSADLAAYRTAAQNAQAAETAAEQDANATAADEADEEQQAQKLDGSLKQAKDELAKSTTALDKERKRDAKLVKAVRLLGQKRTELEDDLADEQDKSSKLEESVKELAAQVDEDEAKVAASVPRENATRLAQALRKQAKANQQLEKTVASLRQQLAEKAAAPTAKAPA